VIYFHFLERVKNMKKYGVFIIAVMTSFSLSFAANAKPKKAGLVRSFGNAVNSGVKSGINGNVKKGIYGKSSIEMAEEKPVAKPATTTEAPADANTNPTGTPVNINMVKKNQSKEEFLATGILYLSSNDYSKALDSFKKAQAISNDIVVQRWVDVTNNKIKIKSVNVLLDETKLPTN
jgi:hypothetical protein